MRHSRRQFVSQFAASAFAAALAPALRAQGSLDKFLLPAPPCRDDLTPAVPGDGGYRPGAPVRSNLRDAGTTGVSMTLTGYVTGLTCGRVKGARIDFWHADRAGKFDTTGFRFRGAVLTGSDGGYAVETIVPGSLAGTARRIGARIALPGKPALVTALFFPGDPSAQKDPGFKPLLVMKRPDGTKNAYTFDFLLDA